FLTVGQRFRDRGFKDGLVDEIQVFDRALTPLEAGQLHDGKTLAVALALDPSRLSEGQRRKLFAYYLANIDAEFRKRLSALTNLREERRWLVDALPEVVVMGEMPTPRPTFMLKRGAYDARGERVAPGTPASLLRFDGSWPKNRLGLARWLTDPNHPLTARVA